MDTSIQKAAPGRGGFAPGWRVRCTSCGATRDAGEAGLIRIWAASRGKRVMGSCSHCGQARWFAVERKPDAELSERECIELETLARVRGVFMALAVCCGALFALLMAGIIFLVNR